MGYYINPAIFNSRVHCLILHSESAEESVYDNKLMTIRQQSAVETGGSSGDPSNPLKSSCTSIAQLAGKRLRACCLQMESSWSARAQRSRDNLSSLECHMVTHNTCYSWTNRERSEVNTTVTFMCLVDLQVVVYIILVTTP